MIVKKKVRYNIKEYSNGLKKSGFRVLGSGAFAVVFHHPSNKNVVVKVHEVEDYVRNDGYIAYVKEIMKVQKNPMVPKINSMFILSPKEDMPFAVTVLERLKEIPFKKADPVAQLMKSVTYEIPNESLGIIDKNFAEVALIMKKLYLRGFSPDFHGGNIMLRPSDNSVVVTDPFCNR